MSDQYKAPFTNRNSYSQSEAYSSAPDLPIGFYSDFNAKFKKWEEKRGLRTCGEWGGQVRGIALRKQKALQNKVKKCKKKSDAISPKPPTKSPSRKKQKKTSGAKSKK